MILTGNEGSGGGSHETVVARCSCTHPEHYVEFGWYQDGNWAEWPELYVHVGMAKLPFFKRLWHGFKYIFGHRTNFPGNSFEECTLTLEEAEELIENLVRARNAMKAESERYADSIAKDIVGAE
jgi:hypothetical protein